MLSQKMSMLWKCNEKVKNYVMDIERGSLLFILDI